VFGLVATILVGTAATTVTSAQSEVGSMKRFSGEFPNGEGPYLMSVPPNWNGIVVVDLDYANPNYADSELYRKLYELGYAGAGSTRGAEPAFGSAVDTPARVKRQLKVLDIFVQKFGQPKRVIAYGRSGAGGLAVAMVELAPERTAGAIGACITTGAIGWFNAKLDAAFVAKVLIAPDSELPLEKIPHDLTVPSAAWTQALTAAQATPEGRARTALAVAIGQLPTWTNGAKPEPDPGDTTAVEEAMFDTLLSQFAAYGGAAVHVRRDFEEASGGAISWNTGTDYKELFNTRTNKQQKKVVEELYYKAGINLEADLARVNAAHRLTAAPAAVAEANRRLGVIAKPKNPVLLFHTSGDALAQPATLEAYMRRAPKDLVRTVVVHSTGHCSFSVAENLAAIDTVNMRLESGKWPDTTAMAMNMRAKALDSSPTRFINYEFAPYNHPFYFDDVYRIQSAKQWPDQPTR
jgi:pimeloyl-ACP methyl ester carboxylesterase